MNQIDEVMEAVCAPKYLGEGESFKEGMSRIADATKDSNEHFEVCQEILLDQRYLPAGRIQASVGAARETTALNCYVSGVIKDDSESIFQRLGEAFQTMRLGGGDGFGFSNLRPKNAIIKTLGSFSSGPISFMHIWNSMCETVKSAGHRRGAMMATMRIDHPDIEEFITCKQKAGVLNNFNISVLITDEFIEAVKEDKQFALSFEGVVWKIVSARMLWNKIMRNTWDHAEPGVIFIDKVNRKNNLWYCEEIDCTNPCGEQPLPPHGACLLGSFNLTKYIQSEMMSASSGMVPYFNHTQFEHDIHPIIRMMDNVLDVTVYPLPEQKEEALSKRRMGVGVTGVANAITMLGMDYGSSESIKFLEEVMITLRDTAYKASINLAKEKGAFPAFERDNYLDGEFIQTLPPAIREGIYTYGIRNSHLLSIAPTGTISLWARNISSGIEPVFANMYNRNVYMPDGTIKQFTVQDYVYGEYGLKGKTSSEITAKEHIDMLCVASNYVDSACSKTANIGDEVTFDEFKELYMMAYDGGASGCTTFRPSSLDPTRGAVLTEIKPDATCHIDPITGEKECAD